MYDDIRSQASPESELMDFLQSTYEAGAKRPSQVGSCRARKAGWKRVGAEGVTHGR